MLIGPLAKMYGLFRDAMRHCKRVGLLAIVPIFILASACSTTPSRAIGPQDGLDAAFESFIQAFNNLDSVAFADALSPDVSVFHPQDSESATPHLLVGRDAVTASFQVVFAAASSSGKGPNIVPHEVHMQRMGRSAIVTFEFERAKGSIGRRTLVYSMTHGRWKIDHIHASNTPAP